ncbi:hypothetical protein QYE76_029980 [Lolium multiflorum]|uniref:Transposase (putative) gypsy type domain-containing protein n=1 Tax=Lolium multiflorum TaxID=4521 RepID=A0AAD8QPL7_LOLMU|nr:hypothetical protein QYE76_029980 [Lolium multiflorum]
MGKKKGTSTSGAAKVSRDWCASANSNRDINKLRALGFISASEDDIRLPGAVSRPKPPKGFTVMFTAFLFRGLSLPAHEFLRSLLFFYGIQLWQLTPNSILHLSIFVTVCEAFLGIDPRGLWRKIFYVKRHNDSNGPPSSVALALVCSADLSADDLRDEVRRLTCLSMKDNIVLTSARPPYDADHSPTEALAAARCYPPTPESGVVLEDDDEDSDGTEDAPHVLEDSDVQGEEATEDDAFVRSRRRKQVHDDLIASAESSPRGGDNDADDAAAPPPAKKSSTSIFAGEDDLDPSDDDDDEVPLAKRAKFVSKRAVSAKESNPSSAKSTPPSRTAVEKVPVSTVIPPGDVPASSAGRDHPIYATVDAVVEFAEEFTRLEIENSQLRKTVRSSADQVLEANRLATDAKNENVLLKEEVKKLKQRLKDEQDAKRAAAAVIDKKEGALRESIKDLLDAADLTVTRRHQLREDSIADALSLAVESNIQVLGLLKKAKGALSRLYSMIFPKMKEDKTLDDMAASFLVDPSEPVEIPPSSSRVGLFPNPSSNDESGLVRRLRDQVSSLDRDITSLCAMAALVKKKGEMATAIEQYALDGLHIATESLGFVASDAAEENKKIHEEVEAMTDIAHPNHGLWLHRLKAVVMAKFKYRVGKEHYYFDKFHAHLTMLVRKELLAGAELAFASTLACYPSLDLEVVANTEKSLGQYYDAARGPAYTIVSRMESCLEKDLKAHWDQGARL